MSEADLEVVQTDGVLPVEFFGALRRESVLFALQYAGSAGEPRYGSGTAEVLARIPEHLVVVRVDDVHWSDWGTRESIEWTLKTLQRVPPWLEAERAQIAAAEAQRPHAA